VIRQGGLKIDGVTITDPEASITADSVVDVRIGRRIWFVVTPPDAPVD
jgi:hypothetical protein